MRAESFEAPQNSRQTEDDAYKTRRKVIDATRQRKHDKTRRTVNDTAEEADGMRLTILNQ